MLKNWKFQIRFWWSKLTLFFKQQEGFWDKGSEKQARFYRFLRLI